MSSALEIFDNVQTVGVIVCLLVTIPTACFVYFKLLFHRPYSANNTFKLIVLNGFAELLNCIAYLIMYQLATYPFMVDFYNALLSSGAVSPLSILSTFLSSLSLNTSLFIALNRLKTILYIRNKNNDLVFFRISVCISFMLTLPAVLDLFIFSKVTYVAFIFNGSVIPNTLTSNQILRTVADIIKFIVSLATLLVNIILCILITRERKYLDNSDRQKFNGEKGLVVTSIVSYAFYMLFFTNNLFARYANILFCGFAQWLFLGLNSITPFWCLILFTPTVRGLAFNLEGKTTIYDIFQTLGICSFLVITIPTASYVYYKLLFFRPFLENYTFKLLVANGITVAHIVSIHERILLHVTRDGSRNSAQIDFKELEILVLVLIAAVISVFLAALGLHTSFFIALHRFTTIMDLRKQRNDSNFFMISLVVSVILGLPSVIDFAFFTTVTYVPILVDGSTIIIPNNVLSSEILARYFDIIFCGFCTVALSRTGRDNSILVPPLVCAFRSPIRFQKAERKSNCGNSRAHCQRSELLNCVAYLFAYQLISYPFMIVFYTSLQQTAPNSLAITFAFTSGVSLNTSLFIALNRLKTIMFIRRQSDDSIFFLISVAISTFLTLPAVLDLCFWTTVGYIPITYNDAVIMVPNNVINNETLRRVSDVIRIVVSLATLVVNIILFFLIARERKFLDISDRQKLNGERGLVLTSIVSYTFYMLYFVNSVLARYLNIVICGFVQWMFLGLNAITPFWYVGSVKMVDDFFEHFRRNSKCLLLFTPSVRRVAFQINAETTVTSIFRPSTTAQNNSIVP
uniref:G protein-coupled receptor n=1 Tax=Pristionchus pacificus TaxID=54126 RepID=A0A8R1YTH5_PRIPA